MNTFRLYIKLLGTNSTWRYYLHNFFRHLTFFSAVLVPFFTEWAGITLFQVQLLQSWFMFWVFVLEVPTGAVADFIGRKYSLALGGLCACLGALIYGSVPRFEFFLLGEFLFAMGLALSSGADQAFIYDSLVEIGKEKESKKIFARAHTFYLLGILFASAIGGVIAKQLGLHAPMLLTAVPFLLSAGIALTFKEPASHQKPKEMTRYIEIVKTGLVFFLRHKKLRLLALDAIAVGAAGYFFMWLYQPVMQKLNIPIMYFGVGHVLLTAVEIVITGNFIRFEKWFGGAKKYFRYTALLTALPFFMVAVYPSVATVLIFIILSGGFGLTRIELMSAFMQPFIPSEKRATVLSSISMFRRFSLMVLNPFVGLLSTYSLGFSLAAVGMLPLLFFFFSPVSNDLLLEKKK